MSKENQFYTYLLLDPRKRGRYTYEGLNFCLLYEPFYVGKGKGERLNNHTSNRELNRKCIKTSKIKKLLKENLEPISFKIKVNLLEEKAFEEETKIIILIGRKDLGLGTLTNMTNGGEGASGYVPTEESKKKHSERMKKRTGWTHTEETKQKMSLSGKGKPSELKGKIYTEEEKAVLYETRRNKPKSKDHNRKNGEGVRRYLNSEKGRNNEKERLRKQKESLKKTNDLKRKELDKRDPVITHICEMDGCQNELSIRESEHKLRYEKYGKYVCKSKESNCSWKCNNPSNTKIIFRDKEYPSLIDASRDNNITVCILKYLKKHGLEYASDEEIEIFRSKRRKGWENRNA